MGILELFDKFRDTIVLKEDCSLERKINYLEKVEGKNTSQQLFMAKRGLEGEKEILYQLKKSNIGMFVLHDVNLVYEDLKAQIDFIVITPWACYFIECKNLIGNITVTEKGDFIREYSYNGHKVRKGLESPYRQVMAQRDVYKKIWLKEKGKLKSFLFEKNFDDLHRVLVVAANGENILNTRYAPKEMKFNIIKSDALIQKLKYDRDHSDKELWDNKKKMEEWARYFLDLNVTRDEIYDVSEKNFEDKEIGNAELFDCELLRNKLVEFRKKRSAEKNIPAYYVFTNDELSKIIQLMPKTVEELKDSKILTDVKVNAHGKLIVDVIREFLKI